MTYHKEILKLQREIASLKTRSEKFEAHRKKTALRKVTSLLKSLGYASLHELMSVVDTVITATSSKKRKRAKVTESLRKGIVAALKTGTTVAAVAKLHKVSTATVNNIKAKAGLTKSKKVAREVKVKQPAKKKSAAGVSKQAVKLKIKKVSHPKVVAKKDSASAPTSAATPSETGVPV